MVPPSTDASGELGKCVDQRAPPAPRRPPRPPDPRCLRSLRPRAASATASGPGAQKQAKKEAKTKLDQRRTKAFRDYFNYAEDIKKIPPHRVLAINRRERAKVLRVKIDCDLEAMAAALEETLVPPDRPHADFLRPSGRDALNRLNPACAGTRGPPRVDRSGRIACRGASSPATSAICSLQPPVHNRRVLAVDPVFKSGCKLAALDQFGNLLGHDVIHALGSKPRKEEAKQKVYRAFILPARTDCRRHRQRQRPAARPGVFAESLSRRPEEQGAAYVIVNEAGASVYSTSQLGREELPEYDATLRGAVSIGRRLPDPLSELVKIEPPT